MLRVPGFVSEVMDLCLQTAPYPNQPMTLLRALALQAFLAGRKVCDPGDNRTNIYLLGLAYWLGRQGLDSQAQRQDPARGGPASLSGR